MTSDSCDDGPCWVCGRLTNEVDPDFEAWQHDTCWYAADRQFWDTNLALDIAAADGVAVLL